MPVVTRRHLPGVCYSTPRIRGSRATVFALLSLVFAATGCAGPAGPPLLSTLSSPLLPAPTVDGQPPIQGPLSSPGGPYLYDQQGRVVFLHGVNAVYKLPPYELFPAPGKPWNFSRHDASLMARLGFNVVRLGITWRGLEPGTAPANDPAICSRGHRTTRGSSTSPSSTPTWPRWRRP